MNYTSYIQNIRWFLSDNWQLVKRNLLHISRDPDQIGGLIIQPIVYTLLFRYLFGGAIHVATDSYVNYLIPGVLVMNIIFSSSITFIGIINDLKKGIIDRFRSLPINQFAIINSHIIASLGRSIIIIFIVSLLGFFLGFSPNGTLLNWLEAIGILLLATAALSSLMAVIGSSGKSPEAAQQLAFIFILPLSMISSAIVPVETMTPFLRMIAENQPFTHVIEAVRGLLLGTTAGNHIYLSVIWCCGITISGFLISSYLFSKRR